MKKDISLKQLEAFCAVVQEKSFLAAAGKLFLKQPTISANISGLEKQLGSVLLKRTKKQVIPTADGREIYKYALAILKLSEKIYGAIKEKDSLSAPVKIGSSNLPGSYILPRLLNDFKKKNRMINIMLKLGSSEEIIDDVISGKAEFGIVGMIKSFPKGIRKKYFFRDNIVLTVPAKHRWHKRKNILPEELKSEPFLIRESGSVLRSLVLNALRRHGINQEQLYIVAELGSNEAIKESIKNNAGIGFLPAIAISEETLKGTLKKIAVKGMNLPVEMYCIYGKTMPLSHPAEILFNYLSRAFRKK